MSSPAARITIGLPVYNGERFLAGTVESVLAQTFRDFELIVSDNASTDGTAEICRAFAARDPRVRHVRNRQNIGAAPNYNQTVALARGEFFKWVAYDDPLEPRCLELLLDALERRPDAVLCAPLIRFVDENGETLGEYDSRLAGSDADRPADRFRALVLSSHTCTDILGLIRRSALEGSILHGDFHGGDRAFLAEMALVGKLIQVREPLIAIREHPYRYTRTARRSADKRAWHDPSKRGPHVPTAQLYRTYLSIVRKRVADPHERWRCYGHLARWWLVNWNAVRMAVDLAGVVAPDLPGYADRLKQRVFGVAPGHYHAGTAPRGRRP